MQRRQFARSRFRLADHQVTQTALGQHLRYTPDGDKIRDRPGIRPLVIAIHARKGSVERLAKQIKARGELIAPREVIGGRTRRRAQQYVKGVAAG